MKNKHVIDLEDISREELMEIIELANKIMANPEEYSEACKGKILATLFYEPSTRTQMSFKTAMLRLGGNVIGFDNPQNSSVSKGESLKDTITVVGGYTDIIAIRHPSEGAAKAASMYSAAPVINAGDGGHLHPTQTLTDVVTLYNEKGAKEAVNKWTVNKNLLQRSLPEAIKNIETGMNKPVQEGFLSKKPKKLKDLKMRDTVSYITLEISDIRDVNDAQILSGYVCSKLEIVDFYISCIDNNDPKYIVPHTRPQLVQFQNDLNRLLTQILKIRPVNRSDRSWVVDVNYPAGWRQ